MAAPSDGPGDDFGRAIPEEPGASPGPGDLIVGPSGATPEVVAKDMVFQVAEVPEPLVGEATDTPLADDEPEGTVPANPLWAMKERRHGQWHLFHHGHPERLRAVVGEGAAAVYAIDDGREHAMLGRPVGVSPSGCQYCIVGRVPLEVVDALQNGEVSPQHAFDQAHEIVLCGTVALDDVLTGEVFDVAHYEVPEEIPREYLPGSEFINFPADIDLDI